MSATCASILGYFNNSLRFIIFQSKKVNELILIDLYDFCSFSRFLKKACNLLIALFFASGSNKYMKAYKNQYKTITFRNN